MREIVSEYIYILYRKLKAVSGGCLYYLCRLFPINSRKIVLSNYEGRQGYSCNPKYIAEELLKRNGSRSINKRYRLIWLVNDINKDFPSEIKKVKNNVWNRAYQLSTAAVWIDNHRKPLETQKRKSQLYIGTWHGAIGFKPVGKLRGSAFPRIAYLVSKHDSDLVDYFLSNSEWCSDMYRRAFFYDGEVLKTGSPRCDILINKKKGDYERIRKEYQIPSDSKILMFAPTFRSGNQKTVLNASVQNSNLDFEKLIKALEEKFGGEWYVFVRLHPILAGEITDYPIGRNCRRIIDVTKRDDAYDLLAVTDLFISDYSSMAFDAAIMKIPVFIYAEDLQEYVKDRGKLLWNAEELPFQVAFNNDELLQSILSFDVENYEHKIDEFFDNVGLIEDGHASERVADIIDDFVVGKG